MWRKAETCLVAVVVLVAACGGDDTAGSTMPVGDGAETPTAAVEELIEAVNAGEFDEAALLAVREQAALAALAEGATIGVVAEALRTGDLDVASNFWAGFAQGSGSYLVGGVAVSAGDTVEEGETEFQVVVVSPEGEASRSMLVTEDDGYRIDLFASFGSGLADKMLAPVERLLSTQTEDARLILDSLQDVVPSLLVAARLPETSPDVSRQLLALVEVITRVG